MEKRFDPLSFLMSLGAGGISVIPFAFLQYTYPHGPGLIRLSDIAHGSLPSEGEILMLILEAIMVVFSLLHLGLSAILLKGLLGWDKESYKEQLNDPLRNAALLAPFISLIMTMNVFIGPVRFFIPAFADNLQAMLLPALVFWALIWIWLIGTVINLLRISFSSSFDVSKISFGWLLHPFALGMLPVTGTGIAAMAKDPAIAHSAAFLSLVSGSMALFLLTVKLISIFKSHFAAPGLPAKQFMPSFLIVVPVITLLAISAFRLGHYAENMFGEHLGLYFMAVTTSAFAFEVWYLMFGLALMKDYLKDHFFKSEFYVTQWGLICPFVAFAVLGSFVYSTFVQSPLLYGTILFTTLSTIALFFLLLYRQARCSGLLKGRMECSG